MKPNAKFKKIKPVKFIPGPRRAFFFNIAEACFAGKKSPRKTEKEDLSFFQSIDVIYRTLCAVLYNFVPTSGHPGGSISSGRIVQGLLYNSMDYDFTNPDRQDSDIISYAGGHKAMGLYAMWALRNELVKAGDKSLLPDEKLQLRLEDLLGFRRNPTKDTPLIK